MQWQQTLITGASAGFGAEFARQLAPEVKTIVLSARRVDRLEALSKELREKNPHLRVEIVPADLSQPDGCKPIVEFLNKQGIEIDFLINNAGLGDLGTFESSDWKRVNEMLMVNIVALTALTHELLAPMIKRGKGSILQVSSTASFQPLPTIAVYAATKSYVSNFSEALRAEVKGKGITVTTLCPGPVKTEFGQVAQRANSKRVFKAPSLLDVSVQKVVGRALIGVRKGRARVVPGKFLWFGAHIWELFPIWLLRPFMSLSKELVGKTD